jgi:hypothetical protein
LNFKPDRTIYDKFQFCFRWCQFLETFFWKAFKHLYLHAESSYLLAIINQFVLLLFIILSLFPYFYYSVLLSPFSQLRENVVLSLILRFCFGSIAVLSVSLFCKLLFYLGFLSSDYIFNYFFYCFFLHFGVKFYIFHHFVIQTYSFSYLGVF